MIVDVAEERGVGANLTTADSAHEFGMTAHDPLHHIELMHMLLDNVVAGKPSVIEPVAHLILDLGLGGVGRNIPKASHVPVHATRNDPADVALGDAADAVDVASLVATLRARDDLELLRTAHRGGLEKAAHSGAVHRDRLLAEGRQAGRHRGCPADVLGRAAAPL